MSLSPRAVSALRSRSATMVVDDYYDGALSFVEFLIDRYRQTSMNEMLGALAETRSLNQAFQKAYRESYAEARTEWLKHLP